MKLYIHELVEDTFANADTGEIIEYSNAIVYDDEHNNSSVRKGRKIIKVKTNKGLLSQVDASDLPGWFNAEIGIATAGKIKLTGLTSIKTK